MTFSNGYCNHELLGIAYFFTSKFLFISPSMIDDKKLLFDSGTNFHKVEKERLLSMMIQNHE